MTDELEQILDIRDYADAKKQIEAMRTITFGAKINVLLLTDRLFGCSKGLREYMQNSTDITVDLAGSFDEAQMIINQKPVDFLIIVGYLEKNYNYEVIKAVKTLNEYVSVIIYAVLDDCIAHVCSSYSITYTYHRRKPIDDFIEYMRQCYEDETAKLRQAHPGITKEQLRLGAVLREKESERLREQAYIRAKKKERRKELFVKIGQPVLIIFIAVILFLLGYKGNLPFSLYHFSKPQDILPAETVSAVITENSGQTAEEIEQINADNEEYARTHPKPDRPPNLITASWMDTEDHGTHTVISNKSYKASEPPVVYLDNENTYHTGRCETYIDKMGADYANPYWLDEVMNKSDFCVLCWPSEVIADYKKAYALMAEKEKPLNKK